MKCNRLSCDYRVEFLGDDLTWVFACKHCGHVTPSIHEAWGRCFDAYHLWFHKVGWLMFALITTFIGLGLSLDR